MWRTSSKPKIQKSNRNFSFSSFKDIENLCAADDDSFSPSDFIHEQPSPAGNKRLSVFHRVRLANSCARAFAARPPPPEPISAEPEPSSAPILIPGAEKRIVVYYTSLRVVRSTFEACRTVQSILQGFRVTIDERDVSMDSAFLEELQRIMGGPQRRRKLTLPRVFIGGRYIGGAEEIRQLHETGELKKFVEGLPPAESGVCEVCGDYRFILCVECSGSHKCYTEKSGFRICTACNENGLIRCPSCYCASL